ncbi:hypothetical protein ESA94_11755 [Lacibacter luteus]|uniref:Uncharacterized protein n=1 Tax=Lacibacter luteus TaxID=2508719 RepID=A0A4Q1CI56_9BACT|nr:hypothetical protein [Lacibacter luteus]RXK59729.1 hypothetical protein ESA94_11755 [Lacibacter luteus]
MVKTVFLKNYRPYFFLLLFTACVLTLISYSLVAADLYVHLPLEDARLYKNIFFIIIVAASFVYGYYLKKQREKLQAIEDYDLKIATHIILYRKRILWGFLNCLLACILFVIIGYKTFFYFALIDVVMMLMQFPNKAVFNKELNDDEIEYL